MFLITYFPTSNQDYVAVRSCKLNEVTCLADAKF